VTGGDGPSSPEERTLTATRSIAALLLLLVLAFAAVAIWLSPGIGGYRRLVVPVALAGLVSPVIGYRLYFLVGSRTAPDADIEARCGAFQAATVIALAVTDGAALLGIVTYMLSSDLAAMTGVVTHVLLTGAIWPTRVRLESFLEPGPPRGTA
jgi:hypothetical protein